MIKRFRIHTSRAVYMSMMPAPGLGKADNAARLQTQRITLAEPVMPRKKTQDEIIRDFAAAHGDRYDYGLVAYVDSKTKVEVICPDHGVFLVSPNHHARGVGCRRCFDARSTETREDFIRSCVANLGDRYDYSRVPEGEALSYLKLEIRCIRHDAWFTQAYNAHVKGHHGCSHCRSEILSGAIDAAGNPVEDHAERTRSSILARFAERHGDTYGYDRFVFASWAGKVTVTCRSHGDFRIAIGNHIRGGGCPVCAIGRRKQGTFKALCAERGVDYHTALKRQQAGMSEERVFSVESLRGERLTTTVTVAGTRYPNVEAAARALRPVASTNTIKRWLSAGMDPDLAFGRVPNPGHGDGIIYSIEHRASGKKYVGLTIQDPARRWEKHLRDASSNAITGEQSLHAAIRAYGPDAFAMTIIDRGVAKVDLEQKEIYWIEALGALIPDGFNGNRGGALGGANRRPIVVMDLPFPSRKAAIAYVAKALGISEHAAKRRIARGRVDVRTPARPGESLVKTKEYKAWSAIIHGALNPGSKDHIPGVAICDAWRSFDAFLADVGPAPEPGMVFSRLDRTKDYTPENCRWMTRAEQASVLKRHRRSPAADA
ncbi:GIY-YIG nuclease family protein [Paracoccus sp. ME4]|uniref:GIY-YIG nuclease family protein n=1 Tax=Paracoccus sp. ME4 TaxID=3138066 RepID=UPI00398B3979